MANKVADLNLNEIIFENIKCKTKFTLPSDKNIVWYVLLIYSIIFAGQSLFTNFASKRGQLCTAKAD